MAMTGVASAQSVLERVLASANVQDTTGIFANTADNIGVLASENQFVVPTGLFGLEAGSTGTDPFIAITQSQFNEFVAIGAADLRASIRAFDEDEVEVDIDSPDAVSFGFGQSTTGFGGSLNLTQSFNTLAAAEAFANQAAQTFAEAQISTTIPGGTRLLNTIDGSITNTVTGLNEVLASIDGSVSASLIPEVNIGNLSTTALGAVNTGEIVVGVNQSIDEAVTGLTRAVSSEAGGGSIAGINGAINADASALSARIDQIGTAAGQTAVLVNSALNQTSIDGSITNDLAGVSGSIGNVLASLDPAQIKEIDAAGLAAVAAGVQTTALGAVNTGTIISGIDMAVQGTISGITGQAGSNPFNGE